MVVLGLFAWQTSVVAQTKPTKTTTKKSKKTTQAGNNLHGEQYSTSDRSGLNSYQSATDTSSLGSASTDQSQQSATTSKTKKSKTTKKTTKVKTS